MHTRSSPAELRQGGLAVAQETLERGKAAAERTTRKFEQGISMSGENLRELSVTLIEMAHANVESAFEFARQAAAAQAPSDIVSLFSTHIPKQLQRLAQQSSELAELGRKLVIRSAPSITPDR